MSGSDSGIRIPDLTNLNAVTDASSIVGYKTLSGRFTGSAMRSYVLGSSPSTLQSTRTLLSLSKMVSIDQFGAVGDNSTDDTAAIQAALNASLVVYIPPASVKYKVTSTLTLRPGHFVFGSGRESCIAGHHTGSIFTKNGASLENSDITIKDLRLFGMSTACNGITFTKQIGTKVEGVIFEGLVNNMYVDQGRYHLVSNCTSLPNQYRIAGNLHFTSTATDNYVFFPQVVNYSVYTGTFEQASVVEGAKSPCIYVRRGISGVISNFNADRLDMGPDCTGIHYENDCQGCKVIGGSTHGAYIGILLSTGSSPTVSPGYCEIVSHDIDAFKAGGIIIQGNPSGVCVNVSVHGGGLTNPLNDSPCISITSAITCLISGVNALQYDESTTGIGIQLSACNSIRVTDCSFRALEYAIVFIGSAVISAQIINNTAYGCTNAFTGDATASGAGSNRIASNRGINPRSVSTPAVPATTVYIPNRTGGDVMVCVYGGSNVTIGVNGTNTGITLSPSGVASGAMVMVPSDGTIGLNYTTAPTWVWVGM